MRWIALLLAVLSLAQGGCPPQHDIPAKAFINELVLEATTESRLYLAESPGNVRISAGESKVHFLVFLEQYPEIVHSGLVARRPPQPYLPAYWVEVYPESWIDFETSFQTFWFRGNGYTFYTFSAQSILEADGPGVIKIIEGYGNVTIGGVRHSYSPGFVCRF